MQRKIIRTDTQKDTTLTYDDIQNILNEYENRKSIRRKMFGDLDHIQETKAALATAMSKVKAITDQLYQKTEEIDYIPITSFTPPTQDQLRAIIAQHNTQDHKNSVAKPQAIEMNELSVPDKEHRLENHIHLRDWYLLMVFVEFYDTLNEILTHNPKGNASIEKLKKIQAAIQGSFQYDLIVNLSKLKAITNEKTTQDVKFGVANYNGSFICNYSIKPNQLGAHITTWNNHEVAEPVDLAFTLALAKSVHFLNTIQTYDSTAKLTNRDTRILQHAYTLWKLLDLNLALTEEDQKALILPMHSDNNFDTTFNIQTLIIALSETQPPLLTEDRLQALTRIAKQPRAYTEASKDGSISSNHLKPYNPLGDTDNIPCVMEIADLFLTDTYGGLYLLLRDAGNLQKEKKLALIGSLIDEIIKIHAELDKVNAQNHQVKASQLNKQRDEGYAAALRTCRQRLSEVEKHPTLPQTTPSTTGMFGAATGASPNPNPNPTPNPRDKP